jgi:hypothetical protein
MALILEVVAGRDEVRQRVRVDTFPFTIGRGYGSDLILDDPYVDPSHARIVQEENGDCCIEDADSLNGLIGSDHSRATRIPLASGTSLRLGRTVLRVRHTADEVIPALRDSRAARGYSRATLGKRGLAGVIGGSAAIFAVVTWLSGYQRAGSGDQLTTVLAFLLIAFAWAGCWAIASRVTQHRFHMLEHLAVFSAAVTLVMIVDTLSALVMFFLPAYWLSQAIGALNAVLALVVLLTAHLGYASSMSLKRRATIAFSIAAAFLALGLTVMLAKSDDFTDVPSFVSTLAPVSAKLIPADGPEELERTATALKPDVDAARKQD